MESLPQYFETPKEFDEVMDGWLSFNE